MRNLKSIGGIAVLSTLLTSTASFADVTAAEVWGDWQDYFSSFGYDLTATEEMSGDTLTINDLKMSVDLPEDEGTVTVMMSGMAFRNQGDGTVAITIPPVMPLALSIDATSGEDVDMTLNYSQTGFTMIVAGTPEEMTYSYTAAELGISLADLMVDGTAIDTAKLNLMMKNVIGNSVMKVANLRSIAQNFGADLLTYDVGFTDPEGGDGTFAMNGQLADLKFSGDSAIPNEFDPENFANVLRAGFAVTGEFSYGGGNSEFSFSEGSDSASGSSSSTSGSLVVEMDESQLRYGGTANGTKLAMSGSDIPFPISLEMAESAFELMMPISKSDEPQDFGLLIKLGDFAVDEGIWGMIDPTGALPHDPATVVLDLAGKANWLFDIMDPANAEAMGGEAPGQLHALTLKDLQVRIAGADLTGTGDFTFDNTDLETFNGMPKPTGAIDLKLVGGNGLMDKLVAMGMMSEDDAMGARMMMGLFARPGDGEDTLTSKIEINEEGHVMANGQRLQ